MDSHVAFRPFVCIAVRVISGRQSAAVNVMCSEVP